MLVASNGGQDKHPAWCLNALHNPAVTVRHGDDTHVMWARLATADEKAELWPRIVESWDRYDTYQRRTARDIPLLILE